MKAILIPADINVPMAEVEESGFRQLCKQFTNISWPERINTQALHDLNVVMVVDEDGHARSLDINMRALILSQYRGEFGLVGDALLLSETMASEGITFTPVRKGVMREIQGLSIQEQAERIHTMHAHLSREL